MSVLNSLRDVNLARLALIHEAEKRSEEDSIARSLMSSDIYSQVNDRILAALEQGIIPWKRPWTGQLATNYDSGKEYRGVNILTLGIAEMVMGYSSPYWITFRQAQKHGGHIKRGEKATYIVFS